MRRKKGKIIVFEGIDGAGAETQSRFLYNYLRKKGKKVEKIKYPDNKGKIGKIIYKYLYKKMEISPDVRFILYLTDIIKDKETIKNWIEDGKTVISDRYLTSLLAYQGLEIGLDKVKSILQNFSFPQPNLIIYLDVSPETSMERKRKEKKILDRNERNKELLTRVSKIYKKLAKNNVLGKWVVVNGERSKREVSEEIKKIVKLKYGI